MQQTNLYVNELIVYIHHFIEEIERDVIGNYINTISDSNNVVLPLLYINVIIIIML